MPGFNAVTVNGSAQVYQLFSAGTPAFAAAATGIHGCSMARSAQLIATSPSVTNGSTKPFGTCLQTGVTGLYSPDSSGRTRAFRSQEKHY